MHDPLHCADVGDNGLCSPWAETAAFHLVLRDIAPVHRPVPCRGYQGLWALPQDVERQVLAQTQVVA